MIYLDSSVAIAQLLSEDRIPRASLWEEDLVSSRLLQYEVWNRVHGLGIASTHGESATQLLEEIAFVELNSEVLRRALEPFPTPVRTLDALHLASLEYIRSRHRDVELACFDRRMSEAAMRLGIRLASI